MSDLNINSNRSQTNTVSHGETIVIKKGGHRASITDKIESLNKTQVEEKIPPAEYPELDAPDYNMKAATPPPKSASPDATFKQAFDQALNDANLSGQDLGDLSPDVAKSQIAYALNHPGVKLDPKVTQLLNNFIQQANQAVREQTGNQNYTFQPPKPSNADVSKGFSDNFNTLLDQSKLSDADKAALTYTHYNPWNSGSLKEGLRNTFNQLTSQAETETRTDFNLGSDESISSDTEVMDNTLNQAYEDAFREASKSIKDEKTRGAVMTLFYHPEAEVQNKQLATEFLKTMQQAASKQVAKEFNLPPGVTLKPEGGQAYDAMLKDSLMKTFNGLASTFPDTSGMKFAKQDKALISQYGDQIKALGLGPHTNLQPPELQRAFDLVRNASIGKLKQDFGLPLDWSPENNKLGKVADETDEGEVKTGDAEGASETEEAWNSAISDEIVNRVKYGIPKIGMDDPAPRDIGTAANFLDYTQNQVNGIKDFANRFMVGGDKISILDAMGAVSAGLSTLRETLYLCQLRETVAAKAVSKMQQAIQQDKTRMDEIERKKAEDRAKKKPFALFKFLRKIVPGIAKLLTNLLKYALWAVDTITGGLVSMISNAAGLEPITKNPMLAAGWINKSQAAKMDMALQIIAMVVEMIVSVILAQPQMVVALMAKMVEMVAQTAAKVAVKVATTVAKTVAKEAVKEAVQRAGIEALKGATREAIEQTVETAVKTQLKEGLKEALGVAGKTGAKDASKSVKAVESVAEKWIEAEAKKIAKVIVREAVEEASTEAIENAGKSGAKTITRTVLKEAGEEVVTESIQQAAKRNADALAKISREMEDVYKDSVKALVKASKKAAGQQMVGSALPNIMLANDIIQGLGQVAGHVAVIPQNIKQAKKVKDLAKIRATLTELNAKLETNKLASNALLDSVGELGKWVGEINKQQSSYWQKAQIHFIVA